MQTINATIIDVKNKTLIAAIVGFTFFAPLAIIKLQIAVSNFIN